MDMKRARGVRVADDHDPVSSESESSESEEEIRVLLDIEPPSDEAKRDELKTDTDVKVGPVSGAAVQSQARVNWSRYHTPEDPRMERYWTYIDRLCITESYIFHFSRWDIFTNRFRVKRRAFERQCVEVSLLNLERLLASSGGNCGMNVSLSYIWTPRSGCCCMNMKSEFMLTIEASSVRVKDGKQAFNLTTLPFLVASLV